MMRPHETITLNSYCFTDAGKRVIDLTLPFIRGCCYEREYKKLLNWPTRVQGPPLDIEGYVLVKNGYKPVCSIHPSSVGLQGPLLRAVLSRCGGVWSCCVVSN